MARQNYFEFIKSMRFDAKKEIDIVKKILHEDIYIENHKTNLQTFFSNGYKEHYPVEKKGQHATFEEKFTAISQYYTSVDYLYTAFEFIIDLYSEIRNKDKFAKDYRTSKKLEKIEDSGWIPEDDNESEIWEETRKHTSLMDKYEKLCERLEYSLDKTNHELITLENGDKIIVEKNVYASEVSQIVSETSIQDAIKVLEYNHFSNKGNIQRKKEILIALANYLEPFRRELNNSEELKDILKVNNQKVIAFEKLFEMYNNFGLRHNNSNQYHLDLSDDELEQWYDDIYTSTLFVILSMDESRILSKLKTLREE